VEQVSDKVRSIKSKKSKDLYGKVKPSLLLKMHNLMIKARLLEERMIKMSKGGDGLFWIGGPGEEGFNVPLGLQVNKGEGPEFDYLQLHYRSSAILTAMGAPTIDGLRQMRSAKTDPYSEGRNFANHYALKKWNVVPGSPTIETQYSTAIGTGIANARLKGGRGVTIVNGGDAGSAEGDFHSCMVWANRPALPLPILIIVTNNGYGISTTSDGQHGEKQISDWAKTFPEMPGRTINGNDPVESWFAIEEALKHCRDNRRPYLLESRISRLNGHSSSSGANRVDEADCIKDFEKELLKRGIISQEQIDNAWEENLKEVTDGHKQVMKEPLPNPEDIWDHFYYGEGPDDSYPKKGGS
jgi:2-oxoisovalerate dehydrogenase E1 component alpha subunit